ncbi:hypothetical protein NW759_008042 [Fusarium solani]|uniref:Metallo-beta-lactamase domain-containing protein n=1 Tax=Fusarium solani TaxID=169388 RepID=A0A9P9KPX5_FUSSL|nr:uncharacterized protein B0J15DRAFT_545998 [Fusarium solani]KAH7265979.1 hypothetical protein B0J15DRAFT_545998 [Fusarium solani]KAJ4218891.1 hypothetical protein NW759_008042 [Fusarium solani]
MIPLQYASLVVLAFVANVLGRDSSSHWLLSQGIEALGGSRNLEAVLDVTYSGGGLFRSRSMSQTLGLNGLDRILAGAGRQNVSFSFEGANFLWARPNLEPVNFSLVVQDGGDGFAATVEGSDLLLAPSAPPSGYKDGLLAAFLVQEAVKMSPLLLRIISWNNYHTIRMEQTTDGKKHRAIYDKTLDISVLLDEDTKLPYLIRSYENHSFFGPSTNDLFLKDYVTVKGVKFPRRFQTIYNRKHLLTEYSVARVLVNTGIPSAHFDGPPGRLLTAHVPRRDILYGFAEIGENNAYYRWTGQYTGTFANLKATQPWKDLPGVWLLTVTDAPSYRQLILELGNNVVVLDAPPHQSLLVLRWVRERLNKTVTHVWPTHHHHDHAYGTVDYVAAGARVIALDNAVDYYSTIPKDRFITYSTNRPFTLGDDAIQATLVHMGGSLHAADHSYAHISPRCSTTNSTTLIFDADNANTVNIAASEQGALLAALDKFAADKVALSATFVAVHGNWIPFAQIINVTGYRYPSTGAQDFKYLRHRCVGPKSP